MLIATIGIHPAYAAVIDSQAKTTLPVITGQNSLSTLEDTPLTIVLANLIVTDPDNIYPTGFALYVLPGTNYTFANTTITPALNFVGTLAVPVQVNNGTAESNVFNLAVSVIPANGVPAPDSRVSAGKRPNSNNGGQLVQPNATSTIATPSLVAPSNGATGVDPSPTLTVHVSNTGGTNMTVSFYGRATNSVGGPFTVVALPDTQCYSGGVYNLDWCGAGGIPDMFYAQTQWIAENRAAQNIVFVSHLGDMTNDGDSNSSEWDVADTAMSYLEDPATTGLPDGVPYGITPGNHDQTIDSGTTVLYNTYFGSSRFSGRSYYGGHYGSDNNNNYEFFSAGGMDFIIIHLEYSPTDGAITWADNLLKTYSNRRAIVSSHAILYPGNPADFDSPGTRIYNGLKDNPNLFLMLCGHEVFTGQRTDTYLGNTIYSLMSDYQWGDNGGDGWLRLMKFVPALNQIQVTTYSPYEDKYSTTSDDQFNLPYRMGYSLIGTANNVPSGTDSSITWNGLTGNTQYDWFAVASDGVSSATSDTWNFATGGGQTLTVSKDGTGTGTVTSNPTGINCGSTCSYSFNPNTVVTLTAAATSPSTFGGWSGAGCSGTGTCQVTMSAAQSVTATFNPPPNQTLTVSKAGAGVGTVTSNPSGINCGSTCSFAFTYNIAVTLTAAATSPSVFGGWSGAGCSGTGTCKVTMSAAQSVTATFNLTGNQTLTVSKSGNGSGTVTSSPSGINCGSSCSHAYALNTSVTLTAKAASGSSFTGWSGGVCSGTSTCSVTMNAPKSVTATFALNKNILTVSKAGTGVGTVTSNPSGINCGSTCSYGFAPNTVVTLSAAATAPSLFGGWSGAGCSGTGTCKVTMSAAQSVTATFNPGVSITVNGALQGDYTIPATSTQSYAYSGLQNGPVEVLSTTGQPIIPSERSFFGPYSTFNEILGIPNSILTTDYWFPWYDNVNMITWVMVGNPSTTATASVTIKIAGSVVGTYSIGPSGNVTPTFDGVQNGPVEVTSNIPVFTSERNLYGYPSGSQSFNETLGYPNNQLTTDYWFTWYDDLDMQTQILVANPSNTATATATIKIAGTVMGTYSVAPHATITESYAGVQNGPVEVTGNRSVVASERSLFGPSTSYTFNEVMGYPNNQLSTDYWFPWYDNVNMITWVMVGNPSTTATASVTIKIAGAVVGTYSIGPSGNVTPTFSGVPNGPVEVTSNINVFTSERVLQSYPGSYASFNEYMGVPNSQLSTDYWFTWYDDLDMVTNIMVGKP